MGNNVWFVWWSALCGIAALNALAFGYSAHKLKEASSAMRADEHRLRRQLLWLSGAYVLGCGIRSVLPLIDVPRLCLHDTWASRIFVGRSVATVAEMCFALQWRVLLRSYGRSLDDRASCAVAATLVPLAAAAEAFSWGAVLMANHLLSTIENSIWTLGAGLVLAAFVSMQHKADAAGRGLMRACLVFVGLYIGFMVWVDLPMWFSLWRSDQAAHVVYLSPIEGLRTALARCTPTRDWNIWRDHAPWLTLYFSAAVWCSLILPHLPVRLHAARRTRPARLIEQRPSGS